MVRFFIDEKKLKEYENSIFIYALGGGLGNVARIIGERIIKTYKPKLIGKIIAYAFPNLYFINKKGRIRNVYEIKLYGFEDNDKYLVLYGMQPGIIEDPGLSLKEQYDLSYGILKRIKKLGVKELITMGGVGVDIEPENPKVFMFHNKYFDKNRVLEKIKDIGIFSNNNVSGMSGMFVLMAEYFKIPAYGLLVETYATNQIPGYIGSAKLIEYLNQLYNFKLVADELKEKGMKVREEIKDRIDKLKQQEGEKKKETFSYFG